MWYPLARARRACAGTLKLFFYYHPNLYQTRSQMRQCLPFPFSLFKPQHDEIGSKRRGRGGAPCAPVYREGRSGARRRVRGLSPLYRAPAVTAIQLQWSIRAHTPQGGRRPCVEWLSAPRAGHTLAICSLLGWPCPMIRRGAQASFWRCAAAPHPRC